MSPPDPIDYLPVRQPSSSKTYDFVEELYPQLAWQTSLPQPPLGDNPLTPGPRVQGSHGFLHGLPGRPSPRAPIPRQEEITLQPETDAPDLCGVYCPAFNGRSIAGPPAPPARA